MERLTGGCLCGAVRFSVEGAPYRVGLCHCLDCRKSHGAIFRTFAMYPAEKLAVTGETAQYRHKGCTIRHFCPHCGSPLFQKEANGDEVEIFVGAFDEHDRVKPTYELWTGRRETWLPEIELPRHYVFNREGKGRSEP
jgi:hypothetical protein